MLESSASACLLGTGHKVQGEWAGKIRRVGHSFHAYERGWGKAKAMHIRGVRQVIF